MSRRIKTWAVNYLEYRECPECGHEEEVGTVLVGLKTEAEAKKEAKKLNGTVTKEWYTPSITEEEIEKLRNEGIPIIKTPYGLGFEGIPMAMGDSPESLEGLRDMYKELKARYSSQSATPKEEKDSSPSDSLSRMEKNNDK